MFDRILRLPQSHSFFLFGARGTGKSTVIKERFPKALRFDLLNIDTETRFQKRPQELADIVNSLPDATTHIILDEIQKLPKLLDVIHSLIESTSKHFILTGSSARKLKRGSANLLAGRAFVYELFPLTVAETGDHISLETILSYGQLPKITGLKTDFDRQEFLRAYAFTYLKEEIAVEQVVRSLEPFRRFLEIAAQMNGKVINYANIGRDIGVTPKTVLQYFMILEDTLLGFTLSGYSKSVRKQMTISPKFYFFDVGVVRALAGQLSGIVQPSTYGYGFAFEHLVILECFRLNSYYRKDFKFHYFLTSTGLEIDLVVERPSQPTLFIEIKSKDMVIEPDLKTLASIKKDVPEAEFVCFSQDPYAKTVNGITVYPWREGVAKYFV